MKFFSLVLMCCLSFSFQAKADTLLDGIWLQDCHVKNNTDILTSKLVVQNGTWKHSFVAHEDQDCLVGYMIFTVYGTVSAQNVNDEDHGDFEVTVSKISYQILDPSVADSFSLSGFCGINDWQSGVEVFVEGNQCGDYKAPATDAKIYSSYAYYGNDQLYLGITKIGYIENSEKSRFEQLDENSFNRYLDLN